MCQYQEYSETKTTFANYGLISVQIVPQQFTLPNKLSHPEIQNLSTTLPQIDSVTGSANKSKLFYNKIVVCSASYLVSGNS